MEIDDIKAIDNFSVLWREMSIVKSLLQREPFDIKLIEQADHLASQQIEMLTDEPKIILSLLPYNCGSKVNVDIFPGKKEEYGKMSYHENIFFTHELDMWIISQVIYIRKVLCNNKISLLWKFNVPKDASKTNISVIRNIKRRVVKRINNL